MEFSYFCTSFYLGMKLCDMFTFYEQGMEFQDTYFGMKLPTFIFVVDKKYIYGQLLFSQVNMQTMYF
jgi:hypothetical protein